MTSILLSVTGAHAWATVTGPLTSGMVGIPITIKCDGAWDGLTKNLVCRCSEWGSESGEQRTILNVGENAVIAHEVMKAGMYLYLGIEGYSSDGKLVIPTTWARCGEIQYGANAGTEVPADPTLPVWEQLQAEIGQLEQVVVTKEQMVGILDGIQSATQAAAISAGRAEAAAKRAEEAANAGRDVSQVDAFGGYDRFYDSIARMQVNPTAPLNIATYDGSNKPTHPKVLYFENGWAGHKYWMTYTPFPGNNNTYENPCIAYSEDGVNFISDGITNPIEDTPMEDGAKVGYNSDSHLVLVNGVMECWWRTHYQHGTNWKHEVIYRKTSVDGIYWSEKEELFRVNDASAGSCLSPAVIFEDGIYKIWTVYKQQVMRYYESTTGADWVHIRDINVDNPDYPTYKVWHIDVIHTEKGYEFAGCYHPTNDYNDNRYIYYAVSEDNITYSDRVLILTPGKTGNFDATELYRPAILRLDNRVRIYYGCRNGGGNWRIGMIEAPNPYLFNAVLKNGIRFDDLEARIFALESGSGGTVAVPCTGISMSASELTFTGVGSQTLTTTVTPDGCTDPVTWESNNTSVATVNGGVVTAIANGNATITARCGSYSASCSVSVSGIAEPVPCTGVSLDKTELTFNGEDTQTITATVTPSDTTDPMVWVSSDPTIATITIEGNVCTVQSRNNGNATITVTCGEHSASCSVSVSGIEVNILNGAEFRLGTVIANTGVEIASTVDIITGFADVSAYTGKKLFLSVEGTIATDAQKIMYYDESQTFIGAAYGSSAIVGGIVPNNAKYARVGANVGATGVKVYIGNMSENEFSTDGATSGEYYESADGTIKTYSSYSRKMMPVVAGEMYSTRYIMSGAFFDNSGAYVEALPHEQRMITTSSQRVFTVSESATQLGFNYPTAKATVAEIKKIEIGEEVGVLANALF